jgi:hypothetical protein
MTATKKTCSRREQEKIAQPLVLSGFILSTHPRHQLQQQVHCDLLGSALSMTMSWVGGAREVMAEGQWCRSRTYVRVTRT